eukprot:351503-Chlamydomonas_euryale.AAC.1
MLDHSKSMRRSCKTGWVEGWGAAGVKVAREHRRAAFTPVLSEAPAFDLRRLDAQLKLQQGERILLIPWPEILLIPRPKILLIPWPKIRAAAAEHACLGQAGLAGGY